MKRQNQKTEQERLNLRPTNQEIKDFPVGEMKMDPFWSSLLNDSEETVEYSIF